ncbi:MAG: IS1595 family transposase [Alphaproteobacteria bacterium]|nr:IS1595 family transposase [Alphaproteobacteria bacterium]
MVSVLSAPEFTNEEAAFAYVEAMLWPNGPVCPHCGNADGEKIGRLQGATARVGLRKCYACRGQFTVRIGTIFEDSHAPMRYWLQAMYLMCSSKKGISTRQLQRTLGVGLKTAWHMSHRIRAAMTPLPSSGPIGGDGEIVEVDETFVTNSPKTKKRSDGKRRYQRVMTLVERGGRSLSLSMDGKSPAAVFYARLGRGTRLISDGGIGFKHAPNAASHETVIHAKGEYVRGDVHTNTVEGVNRRGILTPFWG